MRQINTAELKESLATDIDDLRAPEGYLRAGFPNYNHLFGRDACVSALQLLEYDDDIARCTLLILAYYQAKKRGLRNEAFPGKIAHEHFPGGFTQIMSAFLNDTDIFRKLYIVLLWRFPYYGTVDAGAWFIILLHRYYKKTGDEQFLREMWSAAEGVSTWLNADAISRVNGLVTFRQKYIFGLRNQSWKDTTGPTLEPPVATLEVQGYYYEAYRCLAELSLSVFKDSAATARYLHNAEKIKTSLNEFLWYKKANYFSLATNDAGERDETVTSNPGHLLFTGILSKEQADGVVRRLMSEDLWTPYGIRTLSTLDKEFDANSYQQGSVWPFDNWVTYQGMLKAGYEAEAEKIKDGLFAAHEEFGGIPELYTVSKSGHRLGEQRDACRVQAWSAGALMNMLVSKKPVL